MELENHQLQSISKNNNQKLNLPCFFSKGGSLHSVCYKYHIDRTRECFACTKPYKGKQMHPTVFCLDSKTKIKQNNKTKPLGEDGRKDETLVCSVVPPSPLKGNPISPFRRGKDLWELGQCVELRHLTLRGCPVAPKLHSSEWQKMRQVTR